MVVDPDPVDDRAQMGLPERNLAIGYVFAHACPNRSTISGGTSVAGWA
jgi:hypothetical protein